ncbi:hypothetical protein DPMN_152424 [Dreissena polymorpha]|uniref:Uncharacterized protein n=1 Tax=Dreissena polymorpha TaxID=45954 RepID=A0A9D4FL85_DREPO|nr:hypothetical protein DPMN_152424 [Dreissena polymorpha]
MFAADDSVQYSAVDLWQQERYPNMQYDKTLSQGDGGQGREHTYPPSPYQDLGFAAPNTSYYQQY